MSEARATPERVEPGVYTDDYYLTNCHGYEDFVLSKGRRVGPRFIKALSLAGDLRGKRVLDVGCGRGELVIQSALRGAEAWGIDYAQAAVDIAARALDEIDDPARPRMRVEQMDVKALRFEDGFFDAVFMMDVVEHLYPHELSAAFDELHRTIRPGGVLVMHTSPNKIFEEKVYPHWSRRVNQAALGLSRVLRFSDGLFNETMLPTGREFPHDRFEREMHINEQSAPALAAEVERHGFRVRSTEFWEPPSQGGYFDSRRLNVELRVLDFLRFLRPLSMHPPLNRFFCNHIWMTAERAAERAERA
ncbi:MAG TPA: class I SAM-dependent methyltransferase [Rhodanobacteraceae bacterium]|nr:class I SAM-dependent methyltransferase [Rhodanobacteraceae bacterium]